jgi:hypothetical protein
MRNDEGRMDGQGPPEQRPEGEMMNGQPPTTDRPFIIHHSAFRIDD